MKITSVNNEIVKETAKLLQTKYRNESGLFLIEGLKGVNEALKSNIKLEKIFVLEGLAEFSGENVIETTEAVLNKISEAKTAPKIVAVARKIEYTKNDFSNKSKVILLEGIKDAGNLGTILRTAAAFGIDGIVLYGNTVDLYNPKCVRSAVGNLWKVPTIEINCFEELQTIFSKHERIATLPAGCNVIKLNNYKIHGKTLIMFGSEADGLSEELKRFATKNLTIEMESDVESLNLSVSAAVIMYKLK